MLIRHVSIPTGIIIAEVDPSLDRNMSDQRINKYRNINTLYDNNGALVGQIRYLCFVTCVLSAAGVIVSKIIYLRACFKFYPRNHHIFPYPTYDTLLALQEPHFFMSEQFMVLVALIYSSYSIEHSVHTGALLLE
jgi:hypothetical protein